MHRVYIVWLQVHWYVWGFPCAKLTSKRYGETEGKKEKNHNAIRILLMVEIVNDFLFSIPYNVWSRIESSLVDYLLSAVLFSLIALSEEADNVIVVKKEQAKNKCVGWVEITIYPFTFERVNQEMIRGLLFCTSREALGVLWLATATTNSLLVERAPILIANATNCAKHKNRLTPETLTLSLWHRTEPTNQTRLSPEK